MTANSEQPCNLQEGGTRDEGSSWYKSVLESKAANRQGTIDSRLDVITTDVAHKSDGDQDTSEPLRTLNTDMWAILSAKAEGEAEEKFESCTKAEGLKVFLA